MSLKSGEYSTVSRTSKKCREGVKFKGFLKPRVSSSCLSSISSELKCSSRSVRTMSEPRAKLSCLSKSFFLKASYFLKLGRSDSLMFVRFPGVKHWTAIESVLSSKTLWNHIADIVIVIAEITSRLTIIQQAHFSARVLSFAVSRSDMSNRSLIFHNKNPAHSTVAD